MKKIRDIALLIRNKEDLFEGSRSSLGLAVENFFVHMFVLGVEVEMTEKYKANLDWLNDMEARCYSDNRANAEKYDFEYISTDRISRKLTQMDLVIPF